ncbi:MAG: GNAT family N-acetyltransferase [Deltaproteobacteria bacterium RBG_13_61_14]|nr:MAG: GNAT family N-acetyltransferase [Deltaproteobacteria bacterium RBG_13_61_14]
MSEDWRKKIVKPEKVIQQIQPGDTVFLSTGTGEPRTLIKHLLTSEAGNIEDLELIQLVSVGDTVSIEEKYPESFRLKTFFAGWVAYSAIAEGRVDLIPARFSRIPGLIQAGAIRVNVAFIQISRPDLSGYASLGVSVDAARQAMDQARLVVGEINPALPRTLGDTLVHLDSFHALVESTEPLIEIPRPPVAPVFDELAKHIADLIEDGSCMFFTMGQQFEALARHLTRKRDLGIHSPFITDALMDLIRSGAVSNRRKGSFRGTSVVSYAFGTQALYDWLDMNPLVDFQGIDVVMDPLEIARHDQFVAVFPARQVDLTGEVAFHTGRGRISAGPGESQEYVAGVYLSRGGRIIVALPSRNRQGEPNILPRLKDYRETLAGRNAIDFVVTENGIAALRGKSVRERAMALIDIAHPTYREQLIAQAKEMNLIYKDQIYLPEAAARYPSELVEEKTFKGGLKVKFRPILPSDEDPMRRLFYRFSDEAIYYRYFSPKKVMPHRQTQRYVNVDHQRILSLVGVVGEPGEERIIAEGRYAMHPDRNYADLALVVDEEYQNRGIATYLLVRLVEIARSRKLEGLTADVIAENKPMLRVFEKIKYPFKAAMEQGVYTLTIKF